MNIVIVNIHVKPDRINDFITATVENARSSRQEPGIARFDFLQQADDASRFILIEVYKDQDAPMRHKETEHYNRWRQAVADMMAEPRAGVKYINLHPGDEGW